MSEFSSTAEHRIEKLTNYMKGLLNGEKGLELVKKYDIITDNFIPSDILETFNNIFSYEKDIEKTKIASNKLFNILYKTFNEYPAIEVPKESFLYYLAEDNKQISNVLQKAKPAIKSINKGEVKQTDLDEIKKYFTELIKIDGHYTLKENVLFPVLENNWEHYDCLKLMWSFHDDIRKNIKKTIETLNNKEFDLKLFNKISSVVYFNINTIIFREEKVLFPVILDTINEEALKQMLAESTDIGYAYLDTKKIKIENKKSKIDKSGIINFDTGSITVKEAELIFNHLPVDLTFVDKNDTVKYFSTPKHRIFPRTNAIIGRKVHDCHPPESVDVVEKIVKAFEEGKKDKAAFWIKMGPQFVLIQYFAVRDENNIFLGTLEVSQEVSEIRNLTGERRLLDWED